MAVQEARILLDGAEQRHAAAETRRRETDTTVKAAQGNMQSAQKKQKLHRQISDALWNTHLILDQKYFSARSTFSSEILVQGSSYLFG